MYSQQLVVAHRKGSWGLFEKKFMKNQQKYWYYSKMKGTNSLHETMSMAKAAFPNAWIDCEIGRHRGHLMEINEWKSCCDDGSFIDYDGFGDVLVHETFVGRTSPSRRSEVADNVTHILWYNR